MIRKEAGISQGKLAKSLGVTITTIWNYENGERNPEAPFLQKISEKFNLNLDWLLMGRGEKYIIKFPHDKETTELIHIIVGSPKIRKALLLILKTHKQNQDIVKQIQAMKPAQLKILLNTVKQMA